MGKRKAEKERLNGKVRNGVKKKASKPERKSGD